MDIKSIIDIKFNEYIKILGLSFENPTDKQKFQVVTKIISDELDNIFEGDNYKSDLSEDEEKWILWHIPGGYSLANEDAVSKSEYNSIVNDPENPIMEDGIFNKKDIDTVKEMIGQDVNADNEYADMNSNKKIDEEDIKILENALDKQSEVQVENVETAVSKGEGTKPSSRLSIGSISDLDFSDIDKALYIEGNIEDDANITISKTINIVNTNEEPVSMAINNTNSSVQTATLTGGYNTITLNNTSLAISDGSVQNIVVDKKTDKSITINCNFEDNATVTSNSTVPITLNNKNAVGDEVSVTLNAPGSTVTLSGGKWQTISGEVSENTLIINKAAVINGDLNLSKGNVIVKVARESAIHDVIKGNINLGQGYTINYINDEIDSSNVSNLGIEGTHTLIEDVARNSRFAPGIFASDDIIWNLNNHNITFTNTQGHSNFLLRGSLKLEINGDGIVRNNADDYGFWAAAAGVKIVVNGGTYYAATHVFYAENGTIEINGGEFHLTNEATADKDENGNFKFLLNCKDENYTAGKAKIIVKGGKFYGFDPSNTFGEPGGPVSYVAEGYESVPTNEAYEYGTVYEVIKK